MEDSIVRPPDDVDRITSKIALLSFYLRLVSAARAAEQPLSALQRCDQYVCVYL